MALSHFGSLEDLNEHNQTSQEEWETDSLLDADIYDTLEPEEQAASSPIEELEEVKPNTSDFHISVTENIVFTTGHGSLRDRSNWVMEMLYSSDESLEAFAYFEDMVNSAMLTEEDVREGSARFLKTLYQEALSFYFFEDNTEDESNRSEVTQDILKAAELIGMFFTFLPQSFPPTFFRELCLYAFEFDDAAHLDELALSAIYEMAKKSKSSICSEGIVEYVLQKLEEKLETLPDSQQEKGKETFELLNDLVAYYEELEILREALQGALGDDIHPYYFQAHD